MIFDTDITASETKQPRPPRLPRRSFPSLLAMTVRLVAHEALPALLVLYPLMLLLDDLEPGFVRSVVNPHWFLVAMIVAGVIAGKNESSPSTTVEGEKEGKRGFIVVACTTAVIVGLWIAWRLHAGALGIVVALFAAIAVFAAASMFGDEKTPSQ